MKKARFSLIIFASRRQWMQKVGSNALNIKLVRLGKLQLVSILVLWCKRGRPTTELKISGIQN